MAYIDALYEENFLEYASYVIKDRAIPHVSDGFKPVQRRILHALFELDNGKYHKVAHVVGHTMKYHPHGDLSINAALVSLANKDLFIDKQGNYGNIFTGDPASASRYIECRLTPLARDVLYNPQVTEYDDTYDSRSKEPVSFPAKIPVLLAQGTEGIAVGMATRILPHNLTELLEAQIACLRDEEFQVYPDFPTGGQVDVSGYNDGNGKVVVRAKIDARDPKRIVIRQLPYGSSSESLIASIEGAAKSGKLKIAGISDYTAEDVEIEIRLARGIRSRDTIDALYAFTDCESSISVSLMVIKDGRPHIMSVSDVIRYNTQRLLDILKAELRVEEGQLRDRLHAKTLEQVFIENRIYKEIEEIAESEKIPVAVRGGLAPFKAGIRRKVTDGDIDTLLRIPIRRISQYDIDQARKEMQEVRSRLKEIRSSLSRLKAYAAAFLQGLIEKYCDAYPRRTETVSIEQVDVREAAQRNLRLRYDRKTGYLGHQVGGSALLDVSPYDRVLVIRRTGAYSVHDVPEKLFVDKGMLFCGFVDKDRVYTAVYRDAGGYPFIKRCHIQKFILNKGYNLVPEGCRILKLTTESTQDIAVEYKPRPRVRILEESFRIEDYPIRGSRARGIRLAAREVQSVKFASKKGKATRR